MGRVFGLLLGLSLLALPASAAVTPGQHALVPSGTVVYTSSPQCEKIQVTNVRAARDLEVTVAKRIECPGAAYIIVRLLDPGPSDPALVTLSEKDVIYLDDSSASPR